MNVATTSPEILEQFVQRARSLYSLPAVAVQVLELTNQPTIDAAALKTCIEKDPALTTKILRVVNSSLFSLSRRVTDLNQALALLGTKPLKLLVLGFSLPDELLSNLEADVLAHYWRSTLLKAVAAREISELVWELPGEEAFIAGLLQDIGMLVLIQDLGPTYVAFLDRVWNEAADLQALETSTLGFDHAQLSARLLEHWGLPAALVRAVAQPHDVETLARLPADQRALPQILHLAGILSTFLVQNRALLLNELLEVGGRYHQLTVKQVDALVGSLESKVPQLAEIFSLDIPQPADYAGILMQAYVQLSSAAADVSGELLDGGDDSLLAAAALELDGALARLAEPWPVKPDRPRAAPRGAAGAAPDASTGFAAPDASTGFAAPDAHPGSTTDRETDPGLLGRVAAAVARCRQARCAISLALVELDDFESLFVTQGPQGAIQAVDQLQSVLRVLLDGDGLVTPVGDARFAIIFDDCDRQQGVAAVRRLVSAVRQWSLEKTAHQGPARSLSAGLATLAMPPKNFPPAELIDTAQRCLHGVQLSGGDGVKSIEIY